MKQENLEKAFKDKKGRTIKQYVSISALKEILQLKKKEIRTLCKHGMPYQHIGEKYFFCLEEVFAYLQPKKQRVNKTTSKRNETIMIVDGSHYPETKEVCTGMVIKNDKGIQGYSKLHETPVEKPIYSEFLALYHALCYVKEQDLSNVIIGTDQKQFVNLLKKGEIEYFSWMNKNSYKETMSKMQKLISKLGKRVSIVYANVPKYKELYHHAHALSRRYQNTVIENILPGEKLQVPKQIFRPKEIVKPSVIPTVQSPSKQTIDISFECIRNGYVYFNVIKNGSTKQTKILNTVPTRAAILLAYSHALTASERVTISIQDIPTFQDDLLKDMWIINLPKTKEIVRKLYELTNFQPSNNLHSCLQEIEENTQVA